MALTPHEIEKRQEQKESRQFFAAVATASIISIAGLMWGIPTYNVWQKGLSGKAVLAKAEFSRQARVMAAKAEKEAADYTAESIKIVGEAAQKYPEYRQQEFILAFGDALREGNIEQIIYVPTEAMIPITEAGKR